MESREQFAAVLHGWAEVFMRRSMHDFMRLKKEAGLSMSQLSTLFRLYHAEECGVSDIGKKLGITNAAASQMVDKLVDEGLLERADDPDDRRAKIITLTAEGRALIQGSIVSRRRWMEALTNALTIEEQESIGVALTTLTEAALAMESTKTEKFSRKKTELAK